MIINFVSFKGEMPIWKKNRIDVVNSFLSSFENQCVSTLETQCIWNRDKFEKKQFTMIIFINIITFHCKLLFCE